MRGLFPNIERQTSNLQNVETTNYIFDIRSKITPNRPSKNTEKKQKNISKTSIFPSIFLIVNKLLR